MFSDFENGDRSGAICRQRQRLLPVRPPHGGRSQPGLPPDGRLLAHDRRLLAAANKDDEDDCDCDGERRGSSGCAGPPFHNARDLCNSDLVKTFVLLS